jgi:hypothetical protein
MASTRRDKTVVSAPSASPVSRMQKVSGAIRPGTSESRTESSTTAAGGGGGGGRAPPPPPPAALVAVLDPDEHEHDGLHDPIGHPEVMLGDRRETAQVGERRHVVNRHQLPAHPVRRDRVADRPGQEGRQQLVADQMVFGTSVQRDRPVRIVRRLGHDDDGRPRFERSQPADHLEGRLTRERDHDDIGPATPFDRRDDGHGEPII